MAIRLDQITRKLVKRRKTSQQMLKKIAAQLNISWPPGYEEFMLTSNGAEGFIGKQYLQLWKVQDIPDMNKELQSDEFTPGIIMFGSDGGDEAYAFDSTRSPQMIIRMPFIMSDSDEITDMGDSFESFLITLSKMR